METKSLGDYTVIKKMGQGTLGTSYLAEHRFMKKHYVLKVLPEEFVPDRAFTQRFEEEVAVLSLLDHPHIVKIHNVSFAQGVFFLVMDCITDSVGEATSLTQLVSQEELSEEDTLYILTQVADALDFTHKKKGPKGRPLVHAGLKLNNILVGQRGSNGYEVFLSDLGLSRILGSGALLCRSYKVLADALNIRPVEMEANGEERYTVANQDPYKLSYLQESFLQSFHFLAPEQKRSQSNEAYSPKVDVFAFGVLAYYLLTKELPEGLFPMPSELAPQINKNWDHLIKACLQKNPEKRPESLVQALEQILQKEHPQVIETPRPVSIEREKPSFIKPPQSYTPPPIQQEMPLERDFPPPPPKRSLPPSSTPPQVMRTYPPPPRKAAPEIVPQAAPTATLEKEYDEHTNKILESNLSLGMKQAPAVTPYTPKVRRAKNVEPLLTDMIVVPAGEYVRGSAEGSRDEMPVHKVFLDSFALDTHPVTNEQFVRFLEYMGAEKDENNHDILRLKESRIKRAAGKIVVESGYSKHPVVGITWYGALAYAKWVGKRLPTEAEWEVAALGGLSQVDYFTGDRIEKPQANFFGSDTTAVRSYPPNGYGLYDMAGNVYEWCQDWYAYNYYEVSEQEPENPAGPIQGVYRVLRGGCWKSLDGDMRCAHRHRNKPGTVNRTYGFRCAADA